MRLLAIDSSGMTATVALMTDGALTAEYTTNDKKTHSQTLLPMIAQILEAVGVTPAELDAIAVSKGPGSFTGLRIGAATAKGLGQAIGCPLISVPTLEAMAMQAYGYPGVIVPMMDARRNQVYTGIYRYENGKLTTMLDTSLLMIDEILEKVQQLGLSVMFMGDGALVQKAKIQAAIPEADFAPAFMDRQRAAAVAALGYEYYLAGKTMDAADFGPDYLRASQAEREREEKGKA